VDDLRHGMLSAAILAPHLKKGSAPDPRDYMMRPPPERELSPVETEAVLDVLFGCRPTAPVRDSAED
jgi:hypothetical protein